MTYLFSQARFYCDFFLQDEVFLTEIRSYIEQSGHPLKSSFLNHIKKDIKDVVGQDYNVHLWLLYDNNMHAPPSKSDLPLMAKYEIKMTYDRLRNISKFNSVSLSIIPVKIINFSTAEKKNSK